MPNSSLRTALNLASHSAALGVALFLSAGAQGGVIGAGGVSPAVGPGDTNVAGTLQVGTLGHRLIT
jgi:hypothetical protein